jgi:hypothetical protein
MTSLKKTITSILKFSTHITTNIPGRPIRLVEILAIMSVSAFKIAVILYIYHAPGKEKRKLQHFYPLNYPWSTHVQTSFYISQLWLKPKRIIISLLIITFSTIDH